MRCSIALARLMRGSEGLAGVERERQVGDEPFVGAQEAELARADSGLLADDALDGRRVGLDRTSRHGRRLLAERLEVRLHAATSGSAARIASSTSVAAACASSSVSSPGSFRWSESSVRPPTSTRMEVVHLTHAGTLSAAACTRSRSAASSSRGSTWTTTSLSGSARCTASSTASAAAWPCATASPGETPITTSAKSARRLAKPQPPKVHAGLELRDRPRAPPRAPRRRPVHQHVDVPADQPAAATSTSTATNRAAVESAFG